MSKLPHMQCNSSQMNKDESQNKYSYTKFTEHHQARTFINWYKHMIDNERQNLCLYLADDAILEWFGRTIKTRKKLSAFLKHDMQCSRHDLTTVESINKIEFRQGRISRKDDNPIASPLNSPDIKNCKRSLKTTCNSPEWAEGCNPQDDIKELDFVNKRLKRHHVEHLNHNDEDVVHMKNGLKRECSADEGVEVNSKGDSVLRRRVKRKCVLVTPPNCEVGQGDCLPSTSGADSDRSHDTLNAQLPKLAVECNGYIEFARSRNSRSTDTMKWDRKCKIQISYSQDPLNIGEYIIWALIYSGESKCRRNLLAAFEEAAKEEALPNFND
ncbi:uncharacterized protein LOC131854008 [Achroia grisella]|uniref:uncharacterized protein LOC131854008 n=1 Tax=Achroia grisella TaxID=688607 RepID=UPI0027D30940|nr:uncharacterized protein LOC131854008 [Achroia grisella]